jgi:polyhydroxybutyrate depolymerase
MKKLFIYPIFFVLVFQMSFVQAQTNKTIQHGNETRSYREYVPVSYNPSLPVPLVLAFHGLGDNMINFSNVGFQLLGAFDNFIVVYPEAMPSPLGNAWNAGVQYSGYTLNSHIDDVGFVNALIDSVMSEYSIDPARVYVTGFSMGGFMANRLACELSHRIAAVASAAGTRGNLVTNCNAWRPVPFCHLHGNEDPTVPFTNNQLGMDPSDLVEWWVIFNQCNPNPVITQMPDNVADSISVTHFDFQDGSDGSNVEFYLADGAGHVWLYEPANDVNYTVLIWEFLKKHSLVSLGITDVIEKENIRVFPTIADEIIHIALTPEVQSATFLLYQTNGQLVKEFAITHQNDDFPITTLSNGIYFWKALTDKGTFFSGKVIIHR